MKKVICINDKNQPLGANVVEGKEYEIEFEYINALDQRVYIIRGLTNEGITKMGMKWKGYNSERFSNLDILEIQEKNHTFALN